MKVLFSPPPLLLFFHPSAFPLLLLLSSFPLNFHLHPHFPSSLPLPVPLPLSLPLYLLPCPKGCMRRWWSVCRRSAPTSGVWRGSFPLGPRTRASKETGTNRESEKTVHVLVGVLYTNSLFSDSRISAHELHCPRCIATKNYCWIGNNRVAGNLNLSYCKIESVDSHGHAIYVEFSLCPYAPLIYPVPCLHCRKD